MARKNMFEGITPAPRPEDSELSAPPQGHRGCIHYPATLKAALSLGWNWRNCGADFDYG